MKQIYQSVVVLLFVVLLCGCGDNALSLNDKLAEAEAARFSVGVLLPDVGFGDQSINDLTIKGLMRAQEDFDISWSYYETPTEELSDLYVQQFIEEGHDIIIGISYFGLDQLEKVASLYPDQQFLLIDVASEIENIDGITFKEDEGSYLAGIVAGETSKSGVVGFVGGIEDDILHRFLDGFERGVKSVNPNATLLLEWADSYSDDVRGATIAKEMIEKQADVLYAVAGYTGVGVLQEAQRQGVYAIGVDTDQYFIAERAVITSMTKNVDIVVYDYLKNYLAQKPSKQLIIESGIAENGVGLAPIRILSNANELEQQIEQAKAQLK